jgi:hypothetical protein
MPRFCTSCGRPKDGERNEHIRIHSRAAQTCPLEFTVVKNGERVEAEHQQRTKKNQAAWVHADRIAA